MCVRNCLVGGSFGIDFRMKTKVYLERKSLAAICEAAGYEIPVICTPLELIEEQRND